MYPRKGGYSKEGDAWTVAYVLKCIADFEMLTRPYRHESYRDPNGHVWFDKITRVEEPGVGYKVHWLDRPKATPEPTTPKPTTHEQTISEP